MTQQTKEEIYKNYLKNYHKLSKKEKSKIIDIITDITNHNRKYVIRRLNNDSDKGNGKNKRTGRKKKYSDSKLIEFIINL